MVVRCSASLAHPCRTSPVVNWWYQACPSGALGGLEWVGQPQNSGWPSRKLRKVLTTQPGFHDQVGPDHRHEPRRLETTSAKHQSIIRNACPCTDAWQLSQTLAAERRGPLTACGAQGRSRFLELLEDDVLGMRFSVRPLPRLGRANGRSALMRKFREKLRASLAKSSEWIQSLDGFYYRTA